MSDSKYVATSMDRSHFELMYQKSIPAQDVSYREAIRSLMYLMIGSRPDLASVIGKLSQHAETPSIFHWNPANALYATLTEHVTAEYYLTAIKHRLQRDSLKQIGHVARIVANQLVASSS